MLNSEKFETLAKVSRAVFQILTYSCHSEEIKFSVFKEGQEQLGATFHIFSLLAVILLSIHTWLFVVVLPPTARDENDSRQR